MKRYSRLFAMIAIAVVCIGFVSCGSDDDGDEAVLETPEFSGVSAKYIVTDTRSDYKSIEFTESGNYVIVLNAYATRAAGIKEGGFSGLTICPWQKLGTRAGYANIIMGKYTVRNGNTFVLDGFGTIVVDNEDGSTKSLVITEKGGSTYTLNAKVKTQYPDEQMTLNLCRTWTMESIRLKTQAEGFKFDKTEKGGNLPELMIDLYRSLLNWAAKYDDEITKEQIDEAMKEIEANVNATVQSVEGFIFSQSGTYMVTYGDGSPAISTWTWQNIGKGILHYSWDYADEDEGLAGECKVEFDGSYCVITEETENDDVSMTMIYKLKEVK